MALPAIPGYDMLGTLGEGGMGCVFLARQRSLDRLVAVKLLPSELAEDACYVRRFRQEAQAAALLKHPNIVQIYDAGEAAGRYYFVMEYVAGETAGRRVARKSRLDEASALLIAEAVAVALEHAWSEAGLVHRDVKPDNILIDGDGTVKVADLGLAKVARSGSASVTRALTQIGTPHYCAPEQARGEGAVDCRADIYALGATLYHFVTGSAPFAHLSGVPAMACHITDTIPDVLEKNSGVSMPFAWLVETMLAKDRALRPHNWHAVLDDLDEVMAGRHPLSGPLREGVSTMRRCLRRRLARRPASPVCRHARNGGLIRRWFRRRP